MKFIFYGICLLLLLYRLRSEHLLHGDVKDRFLLVWRLEDGRFLVHIFPHEAKLYIDGDTFFIYDNEDRDDTYVPAIRLNSLERGNILNYLYLQEWCEESPQIVSYPEHLTDIVDILNYFSV